MAIWEEEKNLGPAEDKAWNNGYNYGYSDGVEQTLSNMLVSEEYAKTVGLVVMAATFCVGVALGGLVF